MKNPCKLLTEADLAKTCLLLLFIFLYFSVLFIHVHQFIHSMQNVWNLKAWKQKERKSTNTIPNANTNTNAIADILLSKINHSDLLKLSKDLDLKIKWAIGFNNLFLCIYSTYLFLCVFDLCQTLKDPWITCILFMVFGAIKMFALYQSAAIAIRQMLS